jgi:hypothetical protein
VGMIRLPSRMVGRTTRNSSPNSRNTSPNRSPVPITSPGALSSTNANLKDGTLGDQISSSQFVGLTMFFIVTSFWANFFIGMYIPMYVQYVCMYVCTVCMYIMYVHYVCLYGQYVCVRLYSDIMHEYDLMRI